MVNSFFNFPKRNSLKKILIVTFLILILAIEEFIFFNRYDFKDDL
ncbi:hypothetical protein BAAA27672_05920 [Bifidobacterium animalis subsp. animalis ATCC 27672]|nr:hypothetical protein BAAA27672_05920 [Bifidobacterium animalis subsp. animalis ATCC 27672]